MTEIIEFRQINDGHRIIRSAQKDPALPVFREQLVLQLQASPSINFHSPCKVTRIVILKFLYMKFNYEIHPVLTTHSIYKSYVRPHSALANVEVSTAVNQTIASWHLLLSLR